MLNYIVTFWYCLLGRLDCLLGRRILLERTFLVARLQETVTSVVFERLPRATLSYAFKFMEAAFKTFCDSELPMFDQLTACTT
jgi:hypothetical protein